MCLVGGYEDLKCSYPCCDKDRIKGRCLLFLACIISYRTSGHDCNPDRYCGHQKCKYQVYHLVFLDIIFYFISCLRSPMALTFDKISTVLPCRRPLLNTQAVESKSISTCDRWSCQQLTLELFLYHNEHGSPEARQVKTLK